MKQTWQVSSEQPANHDPCPPALALPRRCTSRSSTPPATAPSAATLRPWRNTSASPGFSVWAMSLLCAVQVMLLFFISLFIRWLHCHFTVIDYTATIPSLITLPLYRRWFHCHYTVIDYTATIPSLITLPLYRRWLHCHYTVIDYTATILSLITLPLYCHWLHCHFTVIDYTATIPSLIPLPLCHYWLHCHFTVVDCTAALVGLRQEKRPLNSIGVFNFKSPTGCPQCAWDFWRTSSCQHSPQSSLTLLAVSYTHLTLPTRMVV